MVPTIEKSSEEVRKKMRRRRSVPQETLPRVGLESNIKSSAMEKIMTEAYNRRRILRVPDEIRAAHPDKHFCFLNMGKLEKNGFYHEGGFELFKTADVPDSVRDKFNKSPDGYMHRNEMVLGWIPKEEYQKRQIERQIIKGKKSIEDIIAKRPELSHFSAHAKITEQVKNY